MKPNREGLLCRIKRITFLNKIFFYISILFGLFVSVGFYFAIDMFYSVFFKTADFNSDDKIILRPSIIIDESLTVKKEAKKKDFDYRKTDGYMSDKTKLDNYYKKKIDDKIKTNLISGSDNICKIDFNLKTKTASISICDDFVFKREVEIALSKIENYKNKLVTDSNSVKSISFEYRK